MRHYIIASHKSLSSGFYSAINEIIGNVNNVMVITAYIEENDLSNEVESVLNEIPIEDELVVFTDIYGGSVNNEFIKQLSNRDFHLIAGVNLPLIITFMLNTEEILTVNSIEKMILECREAMKYCNLDLLEKIEFDEF